MFIYNVNKGLRGKSQSWFRWGYLTENSIDLAIIKGVAILPLVVRLQNKLASKCYKLYLMVARKI